MLRSNRWLAGVLGIAVIAYLWQIGGLYNPRIGDEPLYLQIARVTGASDGWLPLRSEQGVFNTKPPMLFWQGIVVASIRDSLGALRISVFFYTVGVTLLLFLLGSRLRSRSTGLLASLTFLCFFSTYTYGRTFLTNLPENFFLFSPFFILLWRGERMDRVAPWVAVGLLVGAATLYRSFFMVVPISFALLLAFGVKTEWDRTAMTKRLPHLAVVAVVGLAVFGLWPLLDPEPSLIYEQFFVGENLGKLSLSNYVSGMFTGGWPVTRIIFGHFWNSGLLLPIFVAFVVLSFRRRRELSKEERILWMHVIGFLIVFLIPRQRQENYLLSSVPALALLMALRWDDIPAWVFRVFGGIGVLLFGGALAAVGIVGARVLHDASFGWLAWIAPVVGLAVATTAVFRSEDANRLAHPIVVCAFFTISGLVTPFNGAVGRYPQAVVESMKGRFVYVPYHVTARHERHRFLLPGAKIGNYPAGRPAELEQRLATGEVVVVHFPFDTTDYGRYRTHGRRLDLRSRHSAEEIKLILFEGRLDLLFQQEVLVQDKNFASGSQ